MEVMEVIWWLGRLFGCHQGHLEIISITFICMSLEALKVIKVKEVIWELWRSFEDYVEFKGYLEVSEVFWRLRRF